MPKSKPNANATAVEGDEAVETFQESAPDDNDAAPAGKVKVRVLPRGDGRIATGQFDTAANAFSFHKKGDHLFLDLALAKVQEDAGLVEIVSGS